MSTQSNGQMAPVQYVRKYNAKEDEAKKNAAKASFPLGLVGFILAILTFYVQFCCLSFAWYPLFWFLDFIGIIFASIIYITSIILTGIALGKSKKGRGFPKAGVGKGFGIAGLIIAIIGLVFNILASLLVLFLLGIVALAVIIYLIFFLVMMIATAVSANTGTYLVLAALL